jgi:nicotinate-nucleotide adenylyltransferase
MARLVGLLGGTFDPPHLGHLIPAMYALESLALDEIRWLVTPRSPLKPDLAITPAEVRARMVEAAIREEPRFRLSRFDLDRPPPHFAADTVEGLSAAEPDALFVYLMGSDALAELPRWRDPVRLVAACHKLGVFPRPGSSPDLEGLERQIPGLRTKVVEVASPLVSIAAREIRERARAGRPIRYLVPEPVEALIREERLFAGPAAG